MLYTCEILNTGYAVNLHIRWFYRNAQSYWDMYVKYWKIQNMCTYHKDFKFTPEEIEM